MGALLEPSIASVSALDMLGQPAVHPPGIAPGTPPQTPSRALLRGETSVGSPSWNPPVLIGLTIAHATRTDMHAAGEEDG